MNISKPAIYYISAITILFLLGGLAYYANKEAKNLSVHINFSETKFNETDTSPELNLHPPSFDDPEQSTPPPSLQPSQSPQSSRTEKIETYIIVINKYRAQPNIIKVSKNRQINLVIKTEKSYSEIAGFEIKSPLFQTHYITAGTTDSLSFKTENAFIIDVFKQGELSPLYSIQVSVD